jgi:hypothetical protein
MGRSLVGLLLAVAALASPRTAHADVVGGYHECPAGQELVVTHGSATCQPAAPKDCPPGWRGVVGGRCTLAVCGDDKGCESGEACALHSVCLTATQDDYYDYGEEERERADAGAAPQHSERSRIVASPALLAGPMMPKTRRAKPIWRYDATNLCAPVVRCEAGGGTCQKEGVCVPNGARAVAYRGDNIAPARVARKTDAPLTKSEAAADETATDVRAGVARRGCAGCVVGANESGWAGVVGVGLLFVLIEARRRAARRGASPISRAGPGGGAARRPRRRG